MHIRFEFHHFGFLLHLASHLVSHRCVCKYSNFMLPTLNCYWDRYDACKISYLFFSFSVWLSFNSTIILQVFGVIIHNLISIALRIMYSQQRNIYHHKCSMNSEYIVCVVFWREKTHCRTMHVLHCVKCRNSIKCIQSLMITIQNILFSLAIILRIFRKLTVHRLYT